MVWCADNPKDMFWRILCDRLGLLPGQVPMGLTETGYELGSFGASKMSGAFGLSMDLLVRATGTVSDLRSTSLSLLDDLGRSISSGTPPPDLERFRSAFRDSIEDRYGRSGLDLSPALGLPSMPFSPLAFSAPAAATSRQVATALATHRTSLRSFDSQAAVQFTARRLANEERSRQEQIAREAAERERRRQMEEADREREEYERQEALERQQRWDAIGAAAGTLIDTYMRTQFPGGGMGSAPPDSIYRPYPSNRDCPGPTTCGP